MRIKTNNNDLKEYDVFISYRRSNGFYMAKSISTWLKERGLSVFLDMDEVDIGNYEDRIETALRQSKNIVLIMTKGCFDNCIVDKEDWISKEIKIAGEMNPPINIIPVKSNNFSWPKEIHKQLPEQIRKLKRQERVSESIAYVDAMVDRICKYLRNVKYNAYIDHTSNSEFLKLNILENTSTNNVDMAFHSGEMFFRNDEYYNILDYIEKNNIKTRIIINDGKSLENMKVALTNGKREYESFESMIYKWKEKSDDINNNIKVKVLQFPLLKRYYSVSDSNNGIMKLSFYTYGGMGVQNDMSQTYVQSHRYYDFFKKEFEYLWNMAYDI